MTLVQRTTVEEGVAWVAADGVEVTRELQTTVDGVARQLAGWIETTQQRSKPHLFDRSSYAVPRDPFSTIRLARAAVERDDIVGSVAEVTEGLMFHQGFKWESDEADEADVFNQISRDLNLDAQVRAWNLTEFADSQVVVGLWWGVKSYTVRGKGTQARRRKTYDVACPVAMTFLDSMRVVPLQPGPFGQDRLAWHASKDELANYIAMQDGSAAFDPLMSEFFAGQVTGLSRATRDELTSWGIDPNRLIWLNPRNVFRHTRTKAAYQAFPANRLKPVFPLLDLKQQLMEADRVMLVGAANYILLVRKGSEKDPASQEELDNLNGGMKTLAKLPVIVGDHRLNIDIITPDQTNVLASSKYETIDMRILSATLNTLSAGQPHDSRTTPAINGGLNVARVLQSRRHMMKRTIERELGTAVVNHPYNVGKFKGEPALAFTQRTIQTISDAEFGAQVMALRTQRELSRESTLDYFGFDQATEAQRRQLEEAEYDDIFKTQVPFSATAPDGTPVAPQTTGQHGGRPDGGGSGAENPTKQTRPRSKNGTGDNPSTGGNA